MSNDVHFFVYVVQILYIKIVHTHVNDNDPILFSKRASHGIKTKPGSVVVSQTDPNSWILQIN